MTNDDTFNRRQLGGISILMGNAALFANGLIAHLYASDPHLKKAGAGRMVSGALYMGVGGILTRYGNPSTQHQLETLEQKLAEHLQKHGVPLDAEALHKADAHTQKGWFSKLEDFIYDHPMECANVYNLLAATGMLTSGIIRRGHGEHAAGAANLANYGLIAAGTLVSVLPKELTPEQVAQKGQSGTLWGKVQQQPLNFAVWPYMAADLAFGAQAAMEYKTARALPANDQFRPWALAMAGVSAFAMATSFAGDLLTGFSSKKVSSEPKERASAQQKLVEFASSILAKQPPETQRAFAEQAAEYLTHQQGLRMVDLDKHALTERMLQHLNKQHSRSSIGL